MSPLVSVAVVTYNQEAYLEDCIRSILAQDYPNFEIVVADDASTDGTAELLERLDRENPGKLVILRNERNLGVTGNHNVALGACRGNYIAWIGGDDLMLPGKLRAQVRHMEANPGCAICYHDVELFDDEAGRTLQLWSQFDRQRRGTFETLVRHGHFNAGISSMVRASASPPQFDPSVPTASDWLYFVECLASGGSIEPIAGVYARQRRYHANVTASPDASQPPHLLVDHLKSCAIILGRWPHSTPHVGYRMAKLLLMQRWQDGGAHYAEFLKASLAMRFSPRVLAALVAHRLFGVRR
jgi:glycosyltransferase involved in cell wall biosynthesis